MRRKGFTLIELIVVIAIIAILAAIIAPNAFKAVEKAKISGAIEDFRSIKTGAMAFYSDAGVWPRSCTTPTNCAGDNTGFVSAPTTNPVSGWDGPYLEKWPAQAKWGGNYTFTNVTAGTTFGTLPVGGTGERFVTMTNVPATAAGKIDIQMDGSTNANAGDVHYGNQTTTSVNIAVSRDGAID